METAILTTLMFLLWVGYSIYSARYEAKYWHRVSNGLPKTGKEHRNWTIQRSILGFIITVVLFQYYGWYALTVPFILMSSFPFIHDGFYYMHRNDLNPTVYPKRFTDVSTTSTALFTFGIKTRTAFLWVTALGLFVLIYSLWL